VRVIVYTYGNLKVDLSKTILTDSKGKKLEVSDINPSLRPSEKEKGVLELYFTSRDFIDFPVTLSFFLIEDITWKVQEMYFSARPSENIP
jgi:hypothetical protein